MKVSSSRCLGERNETAVPRTCGGSTRRHPLSRYWHRGRYGRRCKPSAMIAVPRRHADTTRAKFDRYRA